MRARRNFIVALGLAVALGSGSFAVAAPKGPATAAASATPTGAVHGRRGAALTGVVNLNQADEAALELLPGIGEKKAKRIVDYRRGHPFRRVDDLTHVKGIGRKTLARLKPLLAVTGATTLGEEAAPAATAK